MPRHDNLQIPLPGLLSHIHLMLSSAFPPRHSLSFSLMWAHIVPTHLIWKPSNAATKAFHRANNRLTFPAFPSLVLTLSALPSLFVPFYAKLLCIFPANIFSSRATFFIMPGCGEPPLDKLSLISELKVCPEFLCSYPAHSKIICMFLWHFLLWYLCMIFISIAAIPPLRWQLIYWKRFTEMIRKIKRW